jgi:hypothetical protein
MIKSQFSIGIDIEILKSIIRKFFSILTKLKIKKECTLGLNQSFI